MVQKGSNRVAAVIIFFVFLFVFAKWGPSIKFSSTTQVSGEPFIVSGEGKTYVVPDIAKITVGIQETGTSLKNVQESVNKKTSALTNAIKKLGIKEEDIKTTSYNLYPMYGYQDSPYKINGYQVSTSYEITIRDFDKVNDVIVAATSAGANMEGNVVFEVNDKTKNEKLNEARKLAVAAAKEKAKGLAGAAGISLGKIINISENQNSNELIRPMYAAGGAALDKASTAPTITPGQTEMAVTVNLSYEVR